jgi:hypothetical protein
VSPHALLALAPADLGTALCNALTTQDLDSARDAFVQVESRFHSLCATPDGSQQFLDQFLPVTDQPEIRALRVADPLVQIVDRLEHLLDLAGERARVTTDAAILHQIVESRERGADLLRILATAPQQGLNAGDLAKRLEITPQNLSPLLATFHAHGIIERTKRGRHVFNTLTAHGGALLPPDEPNIPPPPRIDFMFTSQPVTLQTMVAA